MVSFAYWHRQAVAALWEHQDTEVEAVHLAIALAYHGLLRVPTRAETSDMTPCTFVRSAVIYHIDLTEYVSITIARFTTSSQSVNSDLALCATVRQDGCERGTPIRILRLLEC